MKKLSTKEKTQILEQFLFRLNFHRSISHNEKAIEAMLQLSDQWVNAHKDEPALEAAYQAMKALP